MYDQDFLAELSILAFVIGLANYQENLTQDDKTDIMSRFDEQTADILGQVQDALEEQNAMLREILALLKKE